MVGMKEESATLRFLTRYRGGMPEELSSGDLERYRAVALRAAAKVSRDDQVTNEAANFAIERLLTLIDSIDPDPRRREHWVQVTARHRAMRIGEKLHRELPFGHQGSLPPRQGDDAADALVRSAIEEMHYGGGSLGSNVANRLAFKEAWAALSLDARVLLTERYVESASAADIASRRGLAVGTVHRKLKEAKEAAETVFATIYFDALGHE